MKKILLLKGGSSSEHDISLISADFIKKNLTDYETIEVLLDKNNKWLYENKPTFLKEDHTVEGIKIDYVIPCIHGEPGENGDLQSYFEMIGIPYLGVSSEASKLCYNKVSCKLWATFFGIDVVPFVVVTEKKDYDKAKEFFKKLGKAFIKASSLGSSLGCYPVLDINDLEKTLDEALKLSPYVLVEKLVDANEVEVAVFNYRDKTIATGPGEIVCPKKFYSYEEKYNLPNTTVLLNASIDDSLKKAILEKSTALFKKLKLKDLSRIDFFVEGDQIYLNEINTFPGLTPISLFPKLMEQLEISFSDYLTDRINSSIRPINNKT